MVKEVYQSPEMEAILFDSEDIITTSTPGSGENETPATPW